MLLRRVAVDSVVAISQPHHAWLAGELARAWGGGGFTVPQPREAIVCAAAIHDIGWLEWEQAPQLDAKTGLPLQFWGVPAEQHTKLWRRGVEHAAMFGALPALLVSRHGDSIYERTFDMATAKPEAAAAVRGFLAEQADLQQRVIRRLAANRAVAEAVTDAHLAFTKRFIVAVDTMSLNLCWGITDPVTIKDVPSSAEATTALTLTAAADDEITVDPWPFARDDFVVAPEGRRLAGTFRDQAELDKALQEAPLAYPTMILRPA